MVTRGEKELEGGGELQLGVFSMAMARHGALGEQHLVGSGGERWEGVEEGVESGK
jgi:hypothetical protein